MTFRASLFGESLSDFLTRKDGLIFADDHSGVLITITSTGPDALTYVLLHESTHILDFSCGVTSTLPNKLGPQIWTSSGKLSQPLDTMTAAQTHFRGKPEIPLRKAAELYASLATSPFVSFYATASPQEDLAELVAHREIARIAGEDVTISVHLPGQQSPLIFHPLTFPGVKDRLVEVDALERLEGGCPGERL